MKQVFQNIKNGKLELSEIPMPLLKPDGVLVKNHFSLISSGTEKAVIQLGKKNLFEKARSRPDLVKQVLDKIKTDGPLPTLKAVKSKLDNWIALGYSCAGEVIQVGENIKEFKVGDRVSCAGGGYASHAEYIYVPKNLCTKIPQAISYEQACFSTVGAIALQGIRIANLKLGEKIGVIGLGLVGQLTVQILKAYGFPVIGYDINENNIKRALDFGIDKGVIIDDGNQISEAMNFSNGQGLDAVIITAATSSNQPIEMAGQIAREKARISVVGDVLLNVPRNLYYKKELELIVSRSYGPGRYDVNYEEKGIDYPFPYVRWTEKRNMEEFLRLIKDKKINTKILTTHTFKFDYALKAYDLILNNPDKEKIIGVLLQYSTDTHRSQDTTIYNKTWKAKKGQVNIGLIGVGNFAQGTMIPILNKIKQAHILAAADSNGKNAEKIIKKYNGKYATTDYKTIINDKNIDLVIVTTRHNLHAPIVIEALKNNKNVHVEKPLALNTEELKQIAQTAQASKGRLMVGFNRRFAPYSIKAKEILEKSSSPSMIYARMNAGFLAKEHWAHDPEDGGGRIIGEACHLVNLIQYLIGSRPIQIYASAVPLNNNIQTQDNVFITIDFENGSRGSILYTALGNKKAPKEYIEIFNNNQVIIINNFKSFELYQGTKVRKEKKLSQNKGHFNEFNSLIQAIKNGDPSPIPLNEILESSLATLKIIESLRQNKPIQIKHLW